jgi:hypothetical protein
MEAELCRAVARVAPHEHPFPYWLTHFIETPEGVRYSFDDRPYLLQIAWDFVSHPNIVVEKASQVGLTVLALCSVFYLLARGQLPAGAIYYFPTDTDVEELSKTKVQRLIELNYFGEMLAGTNHVHLKRIGNAYVYFRGVAGKTRKLSITGDIVIADEANEMTPHDLQEINERIHASRVQWKRRFSKPSVPGFGIDREFSDSDQMYWTFRCKGCGKEFDLETTFPDCVVEATAGAYLACPVAKCRKPIDSREGRWIPRNQSSKIRGYHLSQLLMPTVNLDELMTDFRSTDRLARFKNGRLGIAYVEGSGRITASEILDRCGEHELVAATAEPTCIGIDVGRVLHWVAIGLRTPRILGIGTCETFEEMDAIMLSMNCRKAVCDALPETRAAIAFAQRRRPRVWLCYYSKSKGEPPSWVEDEKRRFLRVDCHRTTTLDTVIERLRNRKTVPPKRSALVEAYAKQLESIVRTETVDEKTGDVTMGYVRTADDHWAHATGYAMLAGADTPTDFASVILGDA